MTPNDSFKANETRAKRLADELIRHYAITEPQEIRLEDISMDRNVFVREGSLKGAEAYLARKGKKGVIRIREDIPEVGRKRFAIAHELGHWEMHFEEDQLRFCSEDDIGGYRGSSLEIEANVFASELLIPTRLAGKEYRFAPPCLDTIKNLSETYNVSLTAAAVKFVQLSNEDCLAVFSKDGIVQWWRKGNGSHFIPGVEKNHPLDPESEAHEIFRGRKPSARITKVATQAWFPYLRNPESFEVNEQSIKLGNYPTILTLLWVVSND